MQFRVLGPVEVHAGDGRVLTLARRQERCLLAILALNAGRPVSVDRLCDLLWEDGLPARPQQAIRSYVSRIRAMLAGAGGDGTAAELVAHGGGYLLKVAPDAVDAHRFRRLVAQAAQTADPLERDGLLHDALALWRGPPLDRAASDRVRQRLCAELDELRLHAEEEAIAAGIALGRHRELLPELARRAAEEPVRERLAQFHMLALYRSGRTAEALEVYQHARTRLAEQLGLDPGPALQDLHRAILRGEPAPGTGGPVTPAQLPADQTGFTGRTVQLGRLDTLLREPDAVAVSVITGTAGVGKTALAVHWGHRVRNRFPDGQLYVNLRGYAPNGPLRPVDALAQFLAALGVPGERIPGEVDPAASLYRSVVADRRLLVVLDDARSPAQVRPLLPGAPGCQVVVTSRDRLSGLVARDGAARLDLDVLRPDEAVALLCRFLDERRVATEPAAAGTLAELCAFLPLALRIAAAKLGDRPEQPIADYVGELRSGDRLSEFEVEDDDETGVRAVFALSYAALPAAAARVFRLLSLVPGPDVTTDAVAALADEAAPQLDVLAAAHLVTASRPDRYTSHDLLRQYAGELAVRYDDEHARTAAANRLYEYYLRMTTAAVELVKPETVRVRHGLAPMPDRFTDPGQALAWLDAERANLVAVVTAAAQARHPVAWLLADALRAYFQLRVHRVDWLATGHAAQAAAQAAGDSLARAATGINLANAYERQSRYPEALEHYTVALPDARLAGWLEGEAAVLTGLGNIHQQTARLPAAAEYHGQSLVLKRRLGNRRVEATSLCNLGNVYYAMGRLEQAREHYAEAAALYEQTGARNGMGLAYSNLGQSCHSLGRLAEAEDTLTRALALNREVGNRWMEAETLRLLAEVRRDGGDLDRAVDLAAQALAIASEVGHPWLEATVRNTRGTLCLRLGRTAAAAGEHDRARRLAEQTGAREPLIEALIGLAYCQQAAQPAQDAVALARDNGYRLLEGQALTALATVEFAAGYLDDAVAHARQALALHRGTGHQAGVAETGRLLSGSTAGSTPAGGCR